MKKLLVFVLLATMLLPAIGIAEFDLKSMTDDQLLLLNKELTAELLSRGKTAFVPMGSYVVGENIPEGEYELFLDASKANMFKVSNYYVYQDSSSEWPDEAGSLTETTSVGRLILKNGNVLKLEFGGASMRKLLSFVIEFK